ncbi:MAG: tetratricopeptide repeat protein, partial [Thermoplasmata archaeon]
HKSKSTIRDVAEGIYHLMKCERYEDAARELLSIVDGAIKEGYLNEFYNYISELEKKLVDSNRLIQLIKVKGDILLIWSEWREAFVCYTKALNMLQMNFSSCELDAKERGKRLGMLYESIGIVHRNLDEYERARKYFENALSAYMQAEEKRGIASAQRNVGITYEALGKVKEALECYEASLAILEEIKDDAGIAETCNRIGILYNDELGDALRARSYFERALSIYEMLKDMHKLAGIFANLGETYRSGPDAMWHVVKEMNMKALKIFDKYGDKQGVAVTYVNLGDAYCQQGEYDKAVDYFTRAVKIGEKIGDKELQGEAYCGLGKAYYKENRELAKEYFNKSIEIFEMIKMPNKSAKARELLANC